MGIPKLNKLLLENCSQEAIKKIHFRELFNKKIAVDISIYMYKFLADGEFMENMYLFLSIFKYYCIIPIFIFDGKPPIEKYATLKHRYNEKKKAEVEYDTMAKILSETEDPIIVKELHDKLIKIKKKMIRITTEHIQKTIDLIKAFGFEYYVAPHEADQLCVYLTVIGRTYATLSDDMDIIVSGCPVVLRNLSLLHHEITVYSTSQILTNLDLSLSDFRDIAVLSGNDYSSIQVTIKKAFDYYTKYKTSLESDFYTWLYKNEQIDNIELRKISNLFNIEYYTSELAEFLKNTICEKYKFNVSLIKTIMREHKFIFI